MLVVVGIRPFGKCRPIRADGFGSPPCVVPQSSLMRRAPYSIPLVILCNPQCYSNFRWGDRAHPPPCHTLKRLTQGGARAGQEKGRGEGGMGAAYCSLYHCKVMTSVQSVQALPALQDPGLLTSHSPPQNPKRRGKKRKPTGAKKYIAHPSYSRTLYGTKKVTMP